MPECESWLEYRDIPGFPGYKIGNDGSLWSCLKQLGHGKGKGTTVHMTSSWRQLKFFTRIKSKYQTVILTPGRHLMFAHRLVLLAFVGECPSGMEACHNDGDPSNNNIDNLRWDTRSSNIKDQVKHGRHHGWSYVNSNNLRWRDR